jgi:hypothetical protein
VEDETINYVSDNGFTPLLYYVHQFILLKPQVIRTIQELVNANASDISNQSIVEAMIKNQNNGGGLFN